MSINTSNFAQSTKNFYSKDLREKKELNESENSNREVGSTKAISINQKIINKMYLPYMEKKFYNIALNNGVSGIKRSTRKSSMDNFNLNKRKHTINKLVDGLLIYNNPSKHFQLNYRNKH